MLSLIIFDLIRGNTDDVPYHLLILVILVAVFYGLCSTVGETIAGGVLLVPAVVLFIGLITLWFAGESLRNQGCCMNCSDKSLKKVLVKKSTGEIVKTLSEGDSEKPTLTSKSTCDPGLKATTTV